MSIEDMINPTPVDHHTAHTEIRKKSREQGLIIFSNPPYGTISAQEGQDLALAASAFYPSLSVLFLGDGLLNCLNTQQPSDYLKSFCATFASFPMYDIHHVYGTLQDCEGLGIHAHDLTLPLQLLDHLELQSLLQHADWVLHY
jgi:tRNA 2-thiouridine synthesizing protein C